MGMALPPFQTFMNAHYQDVFRFLVATVGRQDADDCFQETFLAAFRAYPRLQDASNLRGWIFTVAHRKAMDSHRARIRRPVVSESAPERAVESNPSAEIELWEQLGELPPRQRTAVAHRYLNDFSYREIGTIMRCSEEAARQNVYQGLRKLKERWPA